MAPHYETAIGTGGGTGLMIIGMATRVVDVNGVIQGVIVAAVGAVVSFFVTWGLQILKKRLTNRS